MNDLVSIGQLEKATGLSQTKLRQLANAGAIPAQRTQGGHRRFDVAAVKASLLRCSLPAIPSLSLNLHAPTLERSYRLDAKPEHEIWYEIAGELGLDTKSPAGRIAHYSFTEMMNNAIEHSQGTTAVVRFWLDASSLAFEVEDNGIGAFERLRLGFGLPDALAGIQELTKGKRTTDPANHTGEGVFFTSKLVDFFQMSSNGLSWVVDNLRSDQTVGDSPRAPGTTVFCQVDPHTTRDMTDVFRRFTIDSQFLKTRAVVKLFEIGVAFVSRSEARRLLDGLDRFREVELDFKGVEMVGQGFVDEVFRVWRSAHTDVELVPTNMGSSVEFMVRRGLPPVEED